jgi:hypothetical protein
MLQTVRTAGFDRVIMTTAAPATAEACPNAIHAA